MMRSTKLARQLRPFLNPSSAAVVLSPQGGGGGGPDHPPATGGQGILVDANQIVSLNPTLAGAGLQYSAGIVNLGTPGTLSASSSNSAVGATHTHAVAASENAAGGQTVLLKAVAGNIKLDSIHVPTIATVSGNLALSPASGYITFIAGAILNTTSGSLSIMPAGDLILDPGLSNVLPGGTIQDDLGDYNRKWRTLYAAELYVETLVAQDVLATIGGRIMVAPTTKLMADLSSGAATIDVEHNIFASGDYAYMASAPGGMAQVEVLKITSGPTTIPGGYRYSVTRALDGSPANNWVAGDALAHIGGQVGEGYFDITATQTIHNHLGPSLVGYVRSGTAAWNDVKAVTAQGNLRSFVDYAADEFGFAAGNDLTLTPTGGFQGVTIDRTHGVRQFNVETEWYSGGSKVAEVNATDGFVAYASSGYVQNRAYTFSDGANTIGGVYGHKTSDTMAVTLFAYGDSTHVGAGQITATNTAGAARNFFSAVSNLRVASVALRANDGGVDSLQLYVSNGAGSTVSFTLTAGALTAAGQFRADGGSVSVPSISFSTDINSGFYSYANGTVGVASDGVTVFRFSGAANVSDRLLQVIGNAQGFSLIGSDHIYMGFYPDGAAAGRKAYIGFGGASSEDLAIACEYNGGKVQFVNLNNAGAGYVTASFGIVGGTTFEANLGYARNGDTMLDLISDTSNTDYGLRLLRRSGAGGNAEIVYQGTGEVLINAAQSTAALGLFVGSQRRLRGTRTIAINNNMSAALPDKGIGLCVIANKSTGGWGIFGCNTGGIGTITMLAGDGFSTVNEPGKTRFYTTGSNPSTFALYNNGTGITCEYHITWIGFIA